MEMEDRKAVMSWLEGLTEDDWEEWYSHSEVQNTANAAMKLLKEQEAVEPINSYGTFRCGNCRNIVGYNDGHGRGYQNNFCSYCGREVKWE